LARLTDREKEIVASAGRILRWYASPTGDPEQLGTLVTSATQEHVFHVQGGINWRLCFLRELESEGFTKLQRQLLNDFGAGDTSISLEKAELFFQQTTERSNHAFLFNQDVDVGRTNSSVLYPTSDYVTAYHADRSAWTLHMTVEGSGEYFAGNRIYSETNELLLISPRASLHYRRSESTPKWVHYWSLFSPDADWPELMEWPMCAYGVYRVKLSDLNESQAIQRLFSEMITLYENPRLTMHKLMKNLLEQVLIRANNTIDQGLQTRTDARVVKACKYIEEHLTDTLSVAKIADYCNVSESRLAHLFKANLEQGIKGFQDSLRIQRAKSLLATTVEPIANVGAQVGYDDPAQFSKFFSRYLNCSPRAFRNDFNQ